MNQSTKWVIGVVVVVAIVAIGYKVSNGPGGPVSTGPIKIGFIGPLTGEMANIGENIKAAVEIAVEEINGAGGIGGRSVSVIYEDDKCKGDAGANAVNKLVNVDKVAAIIGGACSPATLAAAPIVEAAKVPLLSYCATAPKISGAGDYVFRNVPSDLFQAKFSADYIYDTVGKRKAALLYINNDWGVGLRDAFTNAFTARGGEVVITEAYAADSRDFRTSLTKIKSSNADILYFAGFTDGSIVGIKQYKELGLTIPVFGADAWDDAKVWSEVGSAGDGMMFTAASTNSSDDFKAKMKAKLGTDEIIYCSNYAYDATKIYSHVMSKVGTSGEAVKAALYSHRHEGGVGQPVTEFDQNGDPKAAVYSIKTAKGGKIELLPTAPVAQ